MNGVRRCRSFWRLIVLLLAVTASVVSAREVRSLAGEWELALGAPAPAFPQGAPPSIVFLDRITLPATTETAGKGPENDARETRGLTRVRRFEGPAWYARDVDIPASWSGKRIELLLERTKYTQVWFDATPLGEQALFGSPQVRSLGRVAPGRHRLTILVDNRSERWPAKGWDAHQNSDATQTNWNGLIGRIELIAYDAVSLKDVSITPHVAQTRFHVRATIANVSGQATSGKLTLSAVSTNHAGASHVVPAIELPVQIAAAPATTVETELPLGAGARRWDEFAPDLYDVKVALAIGTATEERVIETGLREFSGRTGQFTINGRTTFLRGKHDGCVFPLTGHPPMDVDGWLTYLGILKTWGFNHLRCHTWIPPEAAFTAADRLGMYVQPELPFWGVLNEQIRDGLMPEAAGLIAALRNHPSFVMLSLGNELQGERQMMGEMIAALRRQDPDILYADGNDTIAWDAREQSHNDWRTAAAVPVNGKSVKIRGSFGAEFGDEGIVQAGDGSTFDDYRAALAGATMPLVAHETGQFQVFPDLREIPRYTGVVQARNFEQFRETLGRRGMLEQATDFLHASGALVASLYKEDQERYLRTAGFGGFQVLDLQDFPGQGTALVGMLNAFMEDKGVTTPAAWRRSCAPVTVLARFDRHAWTTAQHYAADLQLAHYGTADWLDVTTDWSLVGEGGDVVAQGSFRAERLAQGKVHDLGHVDVPLAAVTAPARLELRVRSFAGAGGPRDLRPSVDRAENVWPLWVYPARVAMPAGSNVLVVHAWSAEVSRRLAEGGRVLLISSNPGWADTVGGGYASDYWSWNFFHNVPGTLGLLIQPQHPALAAFPTRSFSEREWNAIARAAHPTVLNDLPPGTRPIVQVIDNPVRCWRLGLVYELAVGRGRLLVCAADLDQLAEAHPEAAQLRASLLAYAGSAGFAPTTQISDAQAVRLFTPSIAAAKPATSSAAQPEHPAAAAVDGNGGTQWTAASADAAQWLAIDLGREYQIEGVLIWWGLEQPGYRYRIEGSSDGSAWRVLSDQTANTFSEATHQVPVDASGVRHVRVVTTALPDNARAGIREFRVQGASAPGR